MKWIDEYYNEHIQEDSKMKMEKPKKVFLVIQSVLTIIGAISSVLMLRRIIVDKGDLLSILKIQ